MNLLITGGLGFIGSNYSRFVLRKAPKTRLVILDNLSHGSNKNNIKDLPRNAYTFVEGDITDERLVLKAIEDVDAVVNFAAETHVDRSISNPTDFVRTNTLGVQSILEAIRKVKKNNIRLVHVGTDEEYGDISDGSFKEEDRLRPSSPYAASKAAASVLIHAYHRTYGLNALVTRCTNNYGPFQFPEKLMPKAIIRASLGLKIPLYGNGRNIRDWIYAEDHCEAIDAVLRNGKEGEVYNVGSGNELENLEVVSAILELLGKPSSLIEFVDDRPGHDLRYSLDSSKIRSQLGWKPKHTFRSALAKTVEWYKKNEVWWKPLADERTLHATPWKLKW